MSTVFSRIVSSGTAAYAVFALARPRHLGAALTEDPHRQSAYDLVATTFGIRDMVISSVGMFGRSAPPVHAMVLVRVAFDLADAAMLAPRADTVSARNKVLAATLGWASLNSAALMLDRRRG